LLISIPSDVQEISEIQYSYDAFVNTLGVSGRTSPPVDTPAIIPDVDLYPKQEITSSKDGISVTV
jgi:hypothetical protein